LQGAAILTPTFVLKVPHAPIHPPATALLLLLLLLPLQTFLNLFKAASSACALLPSTYCCVLLTKRS
jgi:hypothetical protein